MTALNTIYRILSLFVFLTTICLVQFGCGGGSSSGNSSSDADASVDLLTGVYVDSAVEGLFYRTETQSGYTNAAGEFKYVGGESVIFSIGDLTFPAATASDVLSPLDLAGTLNIADVSVVNIARLIQTLDTDGNPSNGITISEAAHQAASGLEVLSFDSQTFDADVAILVANSGSVKTVLIDSSVAISHLQETLGSTPDFTIRAISRNTTEETAGTATFTMKLNSLPNGNVVINVDSLDESEGTASPSSLTFTPENYNANHTVTVTGVDDDLNDGNQDYTIQLTVNISLTADTTGYTELNPDDVSVINIDNDTAGFIVGIISGDTTEQDGGTATFNVKLNSQPDGDVIIDVDSLDESEGTVYPSRLTFTPANYNASHTVTVTGVDDAQDDGSQEYSIQLIVNSELTADTTGYSELDPDDVSVINIDNDTAGFILGNITGDTTEQDGGTATFTVKLSSQPDGDVIIDSVILDESEGTVSPLSLTFTPENYNTNKTVTITGVDDDISDGNQDYTVRLTVNSGLTTDTTGYTFLFSHYVTAVNIDNDSPGITVGPINGNTSEEGMDASFTVRLNCAPVGNVIIDLASSNTSEGVVSSPVSKTMTFTDADWYIDQIATITGVNDGIIDGNQEYVIVLTTNHGLTTDGTGYASLNPDDVDATNLDKNSISVVTSAVAGYTSEDGNTTTFTIRLDSRPSDDVTIALSSSDTAEGTVLPIEIVIIPDEWNTEQTVTLTGVDDTARDGDEQYKILLAAASSVDSDYNGLNPDDIVVTNLENEPRLLPDTGQTITYSDVSDDADYEGNQRSYAVNDDIIIDLNTLLTWGTTTYGRVTWQDARDYCSGLTLDGKTDWRLPNPNELQTIADFGSPYPAIVDEFYFGESAGLYCWTSAVHPINSRLRLLVGFATGGLFSAGNSFAYGTRCVRGARESIIWSSDFNDNGDGTISHESTLLMWQKEDDYVVKTWEEALTYCETSQLGTHIDWKLPNIFELSTIIDFNFSGRSAINETYFPNTKTKYWSSTTYHYDMNDAWYVNFYNVDQLFETKNSLMLVRCVRDEP